MQWSKPDFQEISLGMEVTAYVNTDDKSRKIDEPVQKTEEQLTTNPNSERK
jgi:coenzyme PQQ precursor peptide PqqA